MNDFSGLFANPIFMGGLGILGANDGRGTAASAIGQGFQQGLFNADRMRTAEMQRQAWLMQQKAQQQQEQQRQQAEAWYQQAGMGGVPADVRQQMLQRMFSAPQAPKTAGGMQWVNGEWSKIPGWTDTSTKVNVSPTFSPKAGESIDKQIGPILTDSRAQTVSALRMFDAANRIDGVLQSGELNVGPGATVRQYLGQLATMAGGDNKRVVNTRVVIQALADTAVEARARLAGQGQVTENEARAVEKATAGQYEELTIGELQMLANLNRKAALFTAKQHQDYLSALPESMAESRPFFEVRGMDRILQYNPEAANDPLGIR